MLVLGVNAREEVVIGVNRDIVVTHFKDENGAWKIGVTAPADVPVMRRKVLDRIAGKEAGGRPQRQGRRP